MFGTPGEVGRDLGGESTRVDRLRDVSVTSGVQGPAVVPLHREGGNCNNRDMANIVIFLDPFSNLKTGHPWQLDIHQDQIRPVLLRKLQRLHPLCRLDRRIAMRNKQIMKKLHIQLVVFTY